MKRVILIIYLLSLFSCHQKNTYPKLKDLEGNNITLNQYNDKKILLCFWATWCKSCIEEIIYLQKNSSILEKENFVILLASDENNLEIKKFKKKHHIDFRFVKYDNTSYNFKIHTLPTSIIYNKQKEQVNKIVGKIHLKDLNIK